MTIEWDDAAHSDADACCHTDDDSGPISDELVIGDQPGEFLEADIPGYYHRISHLFGDPAGAVCAAFEFYPEAKLAGDRLVLIDQAEAEWAYLNLRVKL